MPFTRLLTATATSPSMIMKGRTTPLPAPSARRATRKPPTRRMAARAPSSPNIAAEMAEDYRIVFRANGGPEVLEVEKIEPVVPGPGEIRIRQTAIGLNFIDIYPPTGPSPPPTPRAIGSEEVGGVQARGPPSH